MEPPTFRSGVISVVDAAASGARSNSENIDSSGIGELIANYTTISRDGGQLKLLNLTDKIQNLLVITKLLTVFDTYDSENEAVQSFSASAKA